MNDDRSAGSEPYLRNAWYVGALSNEVQAQAPLSRTLLGTAILFYRKADDSPVALRDRCPHRFAPLSRGQRKGDDIVCAYHGLRFDARGACTHNPHGKGAIPASARVRSYPVVERHGFLWIWMGDAPADEAKLPDVGSLDAGPASGVGHAYMPVKAHYQLLLDNVMDLSHVDHLHSEMICTRGAQSALVPPVTVKDGTVHVRWEFELTPSLPIFVPFMPDAQAATRTFSDVTWTAPSHIQLMVGATQGAGALVLDQVVGQYDLHTFTPAGAGETHYFFASRRNYQPDDQEFGNRVMDAMKTLFVHEDAEMVEAVQREMGGADFFDLQPLLIGTDAPPLQVRRQLARLIAEEQAVGA